MKIPALALAGLLLLGCGPSAAASPSSTAPTPTPEIRYVMLPPIVEEHPTLSVWSARLSLPAHNYGTLVLPDAFTVHVQYTSSAPVRARLMTLEEFARFATTGANVGVPYPPGTVFDLVFHDSEGCGAYVMVLDVQEDATIYPNVTVTYAPAPKPTGVCAN